MKNFQNFNSQSHRSSHLSTKTSLFPNLLNIALMVLVVLHLSQCASVPIQKVNYNSTPELLIDKIWSDPPNAWRYVNPENANTMVRPDEKYTVLHAAAFERNFDLIRALVDNGADPGAKARWKYPAGGYSDYVRTPASCALMWNNREIAKYLADRSGEDFEKLIADSEKITERAHAEARVGGLQLMQDVIEFDRSLPR